MKRVTLTIKKVDGDKVVREEQTFTVDRLSFGGMTKLIKEINGVMQDVKSNGDLKNLMDDIFKKSDDETAVAMVQDAKASGNLETLSDLESLEQLKDARFINGIASAFDHIIEHLPERAERILAIASDIPVDVLRKAYAEEILDVYDAIMEVNDIQKVWARVKKSFLSTKDHWMGLVRKATN